MAAEGEQQDVTQILTAGAVQVRLAKADKGVIGNVIARAVLPLIVAGIGTGLYHAEGHAGAREGVTVVGRTHQRIGIPAHVLLLFAGKGGRYQQAQR